MSRVLLLNPPGARNYIRDYFCSKVSKSNYISPPATLLMLSGRVAEKHDVRVLDALAEHMNGEQTLRACETLAPEAVIALVGGVCWDEDRAFLRALKERTGARILGVGDVLLEVPAERLPEAPGLDAVLLDFHTRDVLTWLDSADGRLIPNVVYAHPHTRAILDGGLVRAQGEFRIPLPQHELFPLRSYRFPFSVNAPMSVVLTDYGCPYACTFCVMPPLGFAVRPLEDVLDEVRRLKRLGVREVFFIDQTFGVKRERTLDLCRALSTSELRVSWSCFSRADVTTPELLQAMARAGCHTIIYGVESGNEALRAAQQKSLSHVVLRETLDACRRVGIRTAATFMLGLPGETLEQARETIQWAVDAPLDFASFNVVVPRAHTPLRTQALKAGWVGMDSFSLDQSGMSGAMGTSTLSGEEVLRLRREAVRRFYLRPGYLWRRATSLRSWWDFKTQWLDGWGVVWDALKKP